jgi:hypothetical protein
LVSQEVGKGLRRGGLVEAHVGGGGQRAQEEGSRL